MLFVIRKLFFILPNRKTQNVQLKLSKKIKNKKKIDAIQFQCLIFVYLIVKSCAAKTDKRQNQLHLKPRCKSPAFLTLK